jgi:methyltransferase
MSVAAYAIAAAVALQRLVELRYAERNTKALLAGGAVETGRNHYGFIVALHAAWLVAIAVLLPSPTPIKWGWLGLFVVLQAARVWVIWSLGPYWTTRIITPKDAPLVRRGPYRFLKHPNYVIVACEIFVLPLVFGELAVALTFSLLNGLVLAWRIREEETALAPRRAQGPGMVT